MSRVLGVFVPVTGSIADQMISNGSGIVADLNDDRYKPFLKYYYEGNIYGACNLKTIHERIGLAADRLVHNAPTVAFGSFPSESVIQVGKYDYDTKQLTAFDEGASMLNQYEASYKGE